MLDSTKADGSEASNLRPSSFSERAYGPWLVALGAGLWGTESVWRLRLVDALASDVIVFYEHVILVLCFLPWILSRLGELKQVSRRSLGFLLFSGVAGSAVGTIFFTEALRIGNPTVVNVIPNLQPLISTAAAWLIFRDRLSTQFWIWGPLAIAAGILISVQNPSDIGSSFAASGLAPGTGYALVCAICWALSTVAGRGAMLELSLPLAAGLRLVVGLVCMTAILAARGRLSVDFLWPNAATVELGTTVLDLALLSILAGGLPLLFYFAGLARTRASTAGYFEMMQTLAGVLVTWRLPGGGLATHQIAAAIALMLAVILVQRAQARVQA